MLRARCADAVLFLILLQDIDGYNCADSSETQQHPDHHLTASGTSTASESRADSVLIIAT
jgi:hypothetical protein